jgi:hypothetical protein
MSCSPNSERNLCSRPVTRGVWLQLAVKLCTILRPWNRKDRHQSMDTTRSKPNLLTHFADYFLLVRIDN